MEGWKLTSGVEMTEELPLTTKALNAATIRQLHKPAFRFFLTILPHPFSRTPRTKYV